MGEVLPSVYFVAFYNYFLSMRFSHVIVVTLYLHLISTYLEVCIWQFIVSFRRSSQSFYGPHLSKQHNPWKSLPPRPHVTCYVRTHDIFGYIADWISVQQTIAEWNHKSGEQTTREGT